MVLSRQSTVHYSISKDLTYIFSAPPFCRLWNYCPKKLIYAGNVVGILGWKCSAFLLSILPFPFLPMGGGSLTGEGQDPMTFCTGRTSHGKAVAVGPLAGCAHTHAQWNVTTRAARKLLLWAEWPYFKRKPTQWVLAAAVLGVATSWLGPLLLALGLGSPAEHSTGTWRCGLYLAGLVRPLCTVLLLPWFAAGTRVSPPPDPCHTLLVGRLVTTNGKAPGEWREAVD